MKNYLIILLSLIFIGCNNTEVSEQEFTPTFSLDYSQGCPSGGPVIGEDEVSFGAGRVRSAKGYKNISKISATVDISQMKNLNFVNAAFYMVKSQAQYCDSGNSGSPFCDEIDFIETNGNVATQSTIHLNDKQNYQWAFLNADTSCFTSTSGTGITEAGKIEPSSPFNIVTEFNDDYTNMTTTFIQGDNSVVVYDFQNGVAGEGSNLSSLDGLKEDMENGWKLVASLWQGFAPNPDNLYNYNDPNCKNWSDVCDGSWKISNVKVVAESEVEDVAVETSPAKFTLTVINKTDQDFRWEQSWGMTGPQKGVVNAGGTVKLSSNEVDSDRINLYINPPKSIAKPNPANGNFGMQYGWDGHIARVYCCNTCNKGYPTKDIHYPRTNWVYTTQWEKDPCVQTNTTNTVTITTQPFTTEK